MTRRWVVTRTWEVQADTALAASDSTRGTDCDGLTVTEVRPGEDVATATWTTTPDAQLRWDAR